MTDYSLDIMQYWTYAWNKYNAQELLVSFYSSFTQYSVDTSANT